MKKLARDEESKLIARSQQGDVEAFNELIESYQQIMYGTIFRLLGDYDLASDTTQEAFLAAYKAIRTYRGASSFRAWLLRIGSNLACDHWRKVRRHPTTSLEVLTDEESHAAYLPEVLMMPLLAGDPEQIALTRELQMLIQQGLTQLPLDQRTAVILCDIQGFSYEEIAQTMETNLGTVRSRISRGRARLRDYFQHHKELLPERFRLSK